MVTDITGISDKKAKAVTALSGFGTTIVTEGSNLARYFGRIVGTVPEDLVGVVIGDPLRFVRTTIAARYDQILTEKFKQRGITETEPVSPSIAIPLVRSAYDEGRPQLQELWATLIANAMDPKRSDRIRISFIDTLRKFDPLDALVLKMRNEKSGQLSPNATEFIANLLSASKDEVSISVDNLMSIRCVGPAGLQHSGDFVVLPYGRALIRACSD
jgi:hypothetical protein